jgi:hypothetical protein
MEREIAEDIKRHFDVVAGGLRTEIGELRTEIGGLRTEIGDVKRHSSVLAEQLRTEIRTVAEGFVATNERLDRFEMRVWTRFGDVEALIRLSFAELDRRLQSR